MIIGASIDGKTRNLDKLEQVARTWPDFVGQTVLPRVLPFVERRVSQTLRREPGKVKYPIRWTSAKQRAYYFARIAPRDSEGRVMAYQRTGQMAAAWMVLIDRMADSSEIHIVNNAPAAAYVYGDEAGRHQQWFHQDTGWPNFQAVFYEIAAETNKRMEKVIDQAWEEIWR